MKSDGGHDEGVPYACGPPCIRSTSLKKQNARGKEPMGSRHLITFLTKFLQHCYCSACCRRGVKKPSYFTPAKITDNTKRNKNLARPLHCHRPVSLNITMA